jgi:arylformamidase
MPIIDVSLPLSDALPTYPGNPPFELAAVKRIADGGSSNLSRISMGTHSGTHVDAPRHFFDAGAPVDRLPLDALIGPARVVAVDAERAIQPAHLPPETLAGASRILFKTRNSSLWGSREFTSVFVFLSEGAARVLVDAGVRLVGIDYLSVEEFKKPGAPAHRTLLAAGTVIIEGLDLSAAEPGDYELLCLPLRVAGADGAPARVVLRRDA